MTGIPHAIGTYITSTEWVLLMAMTFMLLHPKYLCKLEMNLYLCIRKSISVSVCMAKILCFLSFKDFITLVEGEDIYSDLVSKNIGLKKVFWLTGYSFLVSQASRHIITFIMWSNSYIILRLYSGLVFFSFHNPPCV